MSINKYFNSGTISLNLFMVFFLITLVNSQDIVILKSNGKVGIINKGSNGGIEKGDLLTVKRLSDSSWEDITYTEVTHVHHNIARIQVIDGAPQEPLKQGDIVKKFSEDSKQINKSAYNRYNSQHTLHTYPIENFKLAYLGPSVGIFIPFGNMKETFEERLSYGGIMGFKFRSNLDISIRFFYTTKTEEWSLWNIQLLGRRYFPNHLLADFGYGVCYFKNAVSITGTYLKGHNIHLGFIGGIGNNFPINLTTQIEIGLLLHIYPNLGSKTGYFLTIQGRLIL